MTKHGTTPLPKCRHPSVRFFEVCDHYEDNSGLCKSEGMCNYQSYKNTIGTRIIKDFPTLYSRSITGKINMWHIYVRVEDGLIFIVRDSGYIDGQITQAKRQIKQGKNIGKSNETTKAEQACSEALSIWNKQIDCQYVENIEDVDKTHPVILPMLAHTYQERGHDITWPAYVQPKLNGVRCITQKTNGEIRYTSRKGKVWELFGHLDEYLMQIMDEIPILDGEIYVHGYGFQEITRLVKKERENNDDLEYWIYDWVDEHTGFVGRINRLKKVFAKYGELTTYNSLTVWKIDKLVLVPTALIHNEEEMIEYHKRYTDDGFEGIMLRNAEGGYSIKHRSANLQKYKEFLDEEFEIIGGEEASGEDRGTVVFRCITKDGVEFSARPEGTREQRAEWLRGLDSLIGKLLTVKFQAWTEDGKPQFPSGVMIRDYEEVEE